MSLLHFHPKRFLPRRKFIFGALAPVAAKAAFQPRKPAPPSRRIFDAHLHCPDDSGNVWQWYPVTRTFEEFDTYLTRTGVQRGIINSVRSQLAKTPQEFIAGN